MNKIYNIVYSKCPIPIQNIIISIAGFQLHNQRYGGGYKKYLDQLLKSQWLSAEELADLQNSELRKLIRHAYNNVPYYRNIFEKHKILPEDIRCTNDLIKLPLLNKETLRQRSEELCSKLHLKKRGTFILNTSGTSGKPLNILCDKESRRKHYAFYNRLRMWNQLSIGVKRVTFAGRTIVPVEQKKPIFWRYDINENNWLFSSYHMTEQNLKYYYKKIESISPEEIISYPSSLFIIAKYIIRNKLKKIRPKSIITSAETLTQNQRKIIEEAFNCTVCDQYGCTEMAHFISQCENGYYHLHPEYGIIEVLDDNNNAVANGVAGRVVCTSFINYTMPLIRYDLGDTISISNKSCGCGRKFQTVAEIVGRNDDILITPDGRPIGRLDPVFKGLKGIYETQIVQAEFDKIVLNMVTDEKIYNANIEEELMEELKNRIGEGVEVEIKLVKKIPKEKNGKFRSVISMVETGFK